MKFNKHSNSEYIPKHAFRMLIVGKSQSGKTYLVKEMLTKSDYYKGFYDHIIIFTKNTDQAHYKQIKNANQGRTQSVEVLEWNKAGAIFLKEFLDMMKEERKENKVEGDDGDDDLTGLPNALVLFDDIGRSSIYKMKSFTTLIDAGRHLNISTMFIAHTLKDVPSNFRKSFTDYILFDMGAHAIKEFYEMQATTLMQPREFAAFCEFIFKEQYKFLYTRTLAHVSKGRFRDGFDNPLYITDKHTYHTEDGKFTNQE